MTDGSGSSGPERVLVAGGGVAGLETARALRALAPELVAVELLCPEDQFEYRPLAVVEPFTGSAMVQITRPLDELRRLIAPS